METPLKLVWRSDARDDFHLALDYIAQRDVSAAERLEDAINACAERLTLHPFLYRPGRIAGTREAVAHPNYLLVYRVGTNAIENVSVLHARQQYP